MSAYTCVGGALGAVIQQRVRDIPDFPKPGILFKDITTVLEDGAAFQQIINALTERYRGSGEAVHSCTCGVEGEAPRALPAEGATRAPIIDAVVGIESRGFIFGAPLAYNLGVGLVLVRKKGKLPYDTIEVSYDLEYGTATVEMHTDAIRKGQRVVIIDDLLATGGTAAAACKLVERQGGQVAECAFVIELAFLKGVDQLQGHDVCALTRYE